jgi:hypothetical protein
MSGPSPRLALEARRATRRHPYDDVNYSTTPPGEDLLRTLGAIDTVAPHIRSHFLLNTGIPHTNTLTLSLTRVVHSPDVPPLSTRSVL